MRTIIVLMAAAVGEVASGVFLSDCDSLDEIAVRAASGSRAQTGTGSAADHKTEKDSLHLTSLGIEPMNNKADIATLLDLQSPDTWEATVAKAQRQQWEVIRELIAVARDQSQGADERRRAILLLGRFQEEEALSFLVKNIELELPLEVVKGDDDMLMSTPCLYVLMSEGHWRAAYAVLSSLDVPKSDKERIYLASVLKTNLGRKVAIAAVEKELSTMIGRPKPQRRKNLEAIRMILPQ